MTRLITISQTGHFSPFLRLFSSTSCFREPKQLVGQWPVRLWGLLAKRTQAPFIALGEEASVPPRSGIPTLSCAWLPEGSTSFSQDPLLTALMGKGWNYQQKEIKALFFYKPMAEFHVYEYMYGRKGNQGQFSWKKKCFPPMPICKTYLWHKGNNHNHLNKPPEHDPLHMVKWYGVRVLL